MAGTLFDLSGKVAVVTGGNSGIGLGFARGIARQGGALAIWARSAEKMAKAKEELEGYGGRVTTQAVDVSSEDEVLAAYAQTLADHGRIDAVFANSGVASKNRSTLTMTSQDYHALLAINMHGAFYTLREGARHMVERAQAGDPGGSLVFCGSLSMFQGIAGIGNYAAAKAGMGAMIRSMAAEFGKFGVRANSVAPGFIKTEMMGPLDQETPIDRHFASKTPIPRPGRASDFEGIAAYLCSDASSFHTGDTIVIDGGSLIYPAYAF